MAAAERPTEHVAEQGGLLQLFSGMAVAGIVAADEPGVGRETTGELEENAQGPPRFAARVGENDTIDHLCSLFAEQVAQTEPVGPPVAAAGDEGNDLLAGKEGVSVPVKKGENRAARLVRPGRTGQDDQVKATPAFVGERGNGQAAAAEGGRHPQQGGPDRAKGKTDGLQRPQPFHRDRYAGFFEPAGQAGKQIAGLAAEGIGDDEDLFCCCGVHAPVTLPEEKEIFIMENISDVVIVGAGISGLATAHFLRKLAPELRVLLVEGGERPGGAIRSFRQDGFLAEWGPHGFLDNVPESRELLEDTGLYREAQQAPLGDFHRYVCHGGKLVQIPQRPAKILTTPLLSPWGKLRVLGDLWIRPDGRDQTIGQWAGRRFGKEILPLVDAAVTGSFSGDFNRLSIDAVMPGVRALEKEHGSVLRGVLKKMKAAKSKAKGRLPAMNNFPQGLERLVEVLASDKEIVFKAGVTALIREEEGWRLSLANGEARGRYLVLALPVNSGLPLLSPLARPPLAEVPMSHICNVVLGYDDSARIPYGFGYLAPEREQRFTLGVLFSSHMFPNRAPHGKVLLEALVGGRRHPERLQLADEEIIAAVCRDISQLMALPAKPVFARVLRPAGGIPQLEMEHPQMLAYRSAVERDNRHLYICGFGWDGIGINDMIKSAKKAAIAIAAGGRHGEGEAAVKAVYF